MCYYQPVPQNLTTFSWNYSKGDYEAFNTIYFQQLDWSELFNDEVEHYWSVLKEHILKVQEQFIPQIKKKAINPMKCCGGPSKLRQHACSENKTKYI